MAEVCENTYDEDGNPINGPGNGEEGGGNSCIPQPRAGSGTGAEACPDTGGADKTCKDWQLSQTPDSCLIDDYINEALTIGGADANVFKLLGIHEQGRLVDLTENGNPISSGDVVGFPKNEAFTTFISEWRSAQNGQGVTQSGYIGYDFGIIKLDTGRNRYGIDTSIKHNISTLKIKQGNSSSNRATKVRLERSADGIKWYGAAILTLPDDDCWNTIHFQNTVPMRYWRLRPIEFNGGVGNYWAVQALEFFDYDRTSIEDIQDKIWHENRDRDYADESVLIKGYYDLVDVSTDLSRFGIELPSQVLQFIVNFNSIVAILGRPLVVGDILELPSEMQFDHKLAEVRKYMEVTDITWSTDGFTPGWVPTLQRVTLQPMFASQETADIFGGLEGYEDDTGFFQNFAETHGMDDGDHPVIQDYSDVSQTIEETADDQNNLPERGRDVADLTYFTEEQIRAAGEQGVVDRNGNPDLHKLGSARGAQKRLYVEDALPPGDTPYTEGTDFPPNPTDGDYHRLTYDVDYNDNIPPRLFRWSRAKHRWIFLEKDKRKEFKDTKPVLQDFVSNKDRVPSDKIVR